MSTTIHVKGSDLPASWRKHAKADPDELLEITIKSESELADEAMPPEENFRPEFIAEVEKSSKEYASGNYIAYEDGNYVEYKNGKREIYIANVPENIRMLLNKMINE